MKISIAKIQIMCLSRQLLPCPVFLPINGETLQQTENYKYIEIIFSRDGRQDRELDTRLGKASAVMRQLYRLVILKRESCTKAKFSVF